MKPTILQARAFAADTLEGLGRRGDAAIIRSGGGDDFPEMGIALSVLNAAQERMRLLERALACYADMDFWEAEVTEGALAFYDRGEVARSALAGKDPLAHRD
jgi:hypothetical protein